MSDLSQPPDPIRLVLRHISRTFNLDATYRPEYAEYRVNLRPEQGGNEATAYYTQDPQDAIATAKAMAAYRDKKPLAI
jgi:hypothetical protein